MKFHPVKKYQLSDHYYFVMIFHCICHWDHYLSTKDVPKKNKKKTKKGGCGEKYKQIRRQKHQRTKDDFDNISLSGEGNINETFRNR